MNAHASPYYPRSMLAETPDELLILELSTSYGPLIISVARAAIVHNTLRHELGYGVDTTLRVTHLGCTIAAGDTFHELQSGAMLAVHASLFEDLRTCVTDPPHDVSKTQQYSNTQRKVVDRKSEKWHGMRVRDCSDNRVRGVGHCNDRGRKQCNEDFVLSRRTAQGLASMSSCVSSVCEAQTAVLLTLSAIRTNVMQNVNTAKPTPVDDNIGCSKSAVAMRNADHYGRACRATLDFNTVDKAIHSQRELLLLMPKLG